MAELRKNSIIDLSGTLLEFKGIQKGTEQNPMVVVRTHPDIPESHMSESPKLMPMSELEHRIVTVGDFSEHLPYSVFANEERMWKTKFGNELHIPYPSAKLGNMLEIARNEGIDCLEAHYLPRIHMNEGALTLDRKPFSYPDGWQRVNEQFLHDPKLNPILRNLWSAEGGWFLIDSTKRSWMPPNTYNYVNDALAKSLNKFKSEAGLDATHTNARMYMTKEWVQQYLENSLSMRVTMFDMNSVFCRLPNYAEYHVMGNMQFTDWKDSPFHEWLWNGFYDFDKKENRSLVTARETSLALITSDDTESESVGFRPMIFPNPPHVNTIE